MSRTIEYVYTCDICGDQVRSTSALSPVGWVWWCWHFGAITAPQPAMEPPSPRIGCCKPECRKEAKRPFIEYQEALEREGAL